MTEAEATEAQTPPPLDERHFDHARDLLAALDVSSADWMDPRAAVCPWVFRGHADADWQLVPPAWRDGATEPDRPLGRMLAALRRRQFRSPRPLRDDGEQREVLLRGMAEIALVSAFLTLIDDLGMAMPGHEDIPLPFDLTDPHWLLRVRELANPYRPSGRENTWEYKDGSFADNAAFALAQHHRMPTRLLDWTRDPMVAAYFAGEGAPDDGGRIAVWAVHRETVRQCRWVRMCTVPRGQIEFVHAQSGLFLVASSEAGHFLRFGTWPGLLAPLQAVGDHPVRKFTLPRSEAPELCRILWRRRISRAHMMPSYDSIAAALQRQWELLEP